MKEEYENNRNIETLSIDIDFMMRQVNPMKILTSCQRRDHFSIEASDGSFTTQKVFPLRWSNSPFAFGLLKKRILQT